MVDALLNDVEEEREHSIFYRYEYQIVFAIRIQLENSVFEIAEHLFLFQ